MISPLDATGTTGWFRIGLAFANAAAAAGPLVSFRWAPGAAAGACYIWRVSVSATITTAFTAAQVLDLQLQKATGWTTNDTGGTVIAFGATGTSNKMRTGTGTTLTPPNTQVTQLMTATAAIVAGTRTLDANAHANLVLPIGGSTGNAVLNAAPLQDLFFAQAVPYNLPIELLNQEGFVVAPITALGAAGVVAWRFNIVWSEGH